MLIENLHCNDACDRFCSKFGSEDCCRFCPERVRELCRRFQLCRKDKCLCSDFDTLLMAAFADGDDRAFDLLYRRNLDWARKWAFRLVGSWQDANDIAQEAFLKILANRKGWKPKGKFQTWFLRIVFNLGLKRLKRAKPTMSIGELAEDRSEGKEATLPTMESPEAILLSAEQTVQLQQATEKLPYRQRQAILLWSQGTSYREIAQHLECSVSAVETLLHRAKRNLRKLFNEE